MRLHLLAALLGAGLLAGAPARAQVAAELRQDATPYNFQSIAGVPLSSTTNNPTGSNGKAPGPNPGPVGTPRQFQGVVTAGGSVSPYAAGWISGPTLVSRAHDLRLPSSHPDQGHGLVMPRAMIGAPFMSRTVSYLFGSIITAPEIDEYGVLLTTVNTNLSPARGITTPDAYWVAEPYTPTNHDGRGYYWSPNAQRVFAVSSGPVDVSWRKAAASTPVGSPANVTTATLAGNTYTVLTRRYIVSTSAVKPVRQMYWTEGDFAPLGKTVLVPTARVGAIHVAYNNSFPERVTNAYPQNTVIEPDPSQRLDETRTLWYDQVLGSIHAYNVEGRVFVEILGDLREDRSSRQHLGFEIVDVIREPTPSQVTIHLGERLTAYPDNVPDDAELFPEPIAQGSASFTYQHTVQGSETVRYFAARETHNQSDLQVHWLEAGVAGLKWPLRFARYQLVWPADVALYSHYVRPLVATEAEAKETAVALPNQNAPFIQYQDPLDQVRGKLTERFEYYSFLAPQYPAHRALLRFNAGEHVRFERVFSWLDQTLRAGDFTGSVATNLAAWNAGDHTLHWTDPLGAPRTHTDAIDVGSRINAPLGETGSRFDEGYLAGHIVVAKGDAFHPVAYKDPFAAGFDEANHGAIIPVNAIPDKNVLEVLWFRRNQASLADGFPPVYWPSVTARYTLRWPTNATEIVLASNRGSGPLLSLQAKGAIYYQNDHALPGYNPNEEHALMQGGQAYALRDDLNILSGPSYSSDPFVLLEYTAEDGRLAVRPFHVVRENLGEGWRFDYLVNAGTVLQAPMPLPLLEVPFAPKLPGKPRLSLNEEFTAWTVTASTPVSNQWALTTDGRHFLKRFETVALQNTEPVEAPLWLLPTSVDTQSVTGYVSGTRPFTLTTYGGAQPTNALRWRFAVAHPTGLASNLTVVVANPTNNTFTAGTVSGLDTTNGMVEVAFAAAPSTADKASTVLFLREATGSVGHFNQWRIASEPLPQAIANETLRRQYASFTLEDRKGNTWVYRGPHDPNVEATTTLQFYYKTLPGFYFPGLALDAQPAVGTITPYLRTRRADGTYVGDGVYGNSNSDQVGDGNALGITYHPRWPENTPVLDMAETLTLPKRGLPAVRGQTSVQLVYQQSEALAGESARTVVLHDPTREKTFDFADPSSTTRLGKIPDSISTSSYRGRLYFPRLAPHLVERLVFDPNRGPNGALVFRGEFVNAALGDDYLFLNVLGAADLDALKALCLAEDTRKAAWDEAITQLATQLELFVEDPGKPGTYIPSPDIRLEVGATQIPEITDSDIAVDSYALSATGPGTGYVTLIAGNGRAFTPESEPVSVYVIRVVDKLYRGEVNVVKSSNPLNERLTMQQVVDLAGHAEDYRFEWKIAAPVDGLPPLVYQNTLANLVGAGTWSHVPYPLPTDQAASIHTAAAARVVADVETAVIPIGVIPFNTVSQEGDRFVFQVTAPHRLSAGNRVVLHKHDGLTLQGVVHGITGTNEVVVEPLANQAVTAVAADILQLQEGVEPGAAQSILFRSFDLPLDRTYTEVWLGLGLADALGARVYIDGQLAVVANQESGNTPTADAPAAVTPLGKSYRLSPSILSGGALLPANAGTRHHVAVELTSAAVPGAMQNFNLRLDAFESVDISDRSWLPIDAERYPDGVRTVLGGTADVRSLSDNYVIMRYQARTNTHASWRSAPGDVTRNLGWSQWTTPALAEGWIKRVLEGLNPFNQRITDLLNNAVNTDVSIVSQAGQRWEGDVALNLDTINDSGLIEIYETVLNRGKMLSIRGGINYGPANDALLLAAGYLNDLYLMLGNEAWADAANPTIGIGTKDNTYGDIATALFSFKGQLPSLLEEELALLRGRDDFLLPGVELRPVYNRLIWNYTRGIDSGEVIYALNYNILDQNNDGAVNADDARRLFPQGHGDAYGHYLTALKGYYTLLLDPNFDWVPRIEAVNVLGKAVSVDYQDERKFAAAAAALARAGSQILDLTWRRDYLFGTGHGWSHLAATKSNTTTRNLPVTRYWGVDHWAARTGQGAYLNWIVGNAILPDADPDPDHAGSIQQVDRTTVPELVELTTLAKRVQTSLDNAEGSLLPLGLPANTVPFDLNPLQIGGGSDVSTHFEQVYSRATETLNNAMVAFDDAKDVTRLMRAEQDSLAEYRAAIVEQERAFNGNLIELYGTPYPDDIGPGRTFASGYEGPDLVHYMYVDNAELSFGNLLTPESDTTWRIDLQTFPPNWLNSDGIADFSFIKKARSSPVDGVSNPDNSYLTNRTLYVEYNLSSHGFFKKPTTWTGKRRSPGSIQQAASEIIQARNAAYEAFYKADAAKYDLDWAILSFERKKASHDKIRDWQTAVIALDQVLSTAKLAAEITDKYLDATSDQISSIGQAAANSLPTVFIAGLAAGGDLTAPARGAIEASGVTFKSVTEWSKVISFSVIQALDYANETQKRFIEFDQIAREEWNQELRDATSEIRDKVYGVNNELMAINAALQHLDDTQRAYRALVAEGERVQAEREAVRQRTAAVIQGYRTRDAAFRIFRNEKLERYKTLFDLAAQYCFMAAQAFDYDTGLLHTAQGQEFINRIVRARSLGVMTDGKPEFAGSESGDPGLSSAMAEMNADWLVLKGRLGFKNPDAQGTTLSLRSENFRILPGAEGQSSWTDVLNRGRKANLLEDTDVRRYCMQIDQGNGLPVPGLILEFSTTVADGYNLFGRPLASGDHAFSAATFATKVFAIGVALEGYKGMDDPLANGSATGSANSQSPADPASSFLDPLAMSANPYIYLIPVGVDSMRSPPLGDASVIRTWSVEDVAIPLPFNIGGSDASTAKLWQSSQSLTEPIFAIRKHAPFRPVSSAEVFANQDIYWGGGEFDRTQYTSTRLLGRSVWNSRWKLVIPGKTLLNNPNDGLDRFIRSVNDVKLYFVTYSYAGN